MSQETDQRVQLLLDIEEIKNLKASYCYLADAGIAGDLSKYDELVGHFAEEGFVDFEGVGVFRGKAALEEFFKGVVHPLWAYAAHMVMNPLIRVDGDSATGKWFVHVACTLREENRAAWIQGKYEEEYVRVDGVWKWHSISFKPDFQTTYEEGWVKRPDLAEVIGHKMEDS